MQTPFNRPVVNADIERGRIIEVLEDTDPRIPELFANAIANARSAEKCRFFTLHENGTILMENGNSRLGTRLMSRFDPTNVKSVTTFLGTRIAAARASRAWKTGCWSKDTAAGRILGLKVVPGPNGCKGHCSERVHLHFWTGGTDRSVTAPIIVDTRDADEYHSWMNVLMENVVRLIPGVVPAWKCQHGLTGILKKRWDGNLTWTLCDYCYPDEQPKANRLPLVSETTDIQTIDADLRRAVHASYDGRCQYCREAVPFVDMEIDHVLPRSKPIDTIRSELIARGHDPALVDAFVVDHWHGTHDCILNYTLACVTCNGVKSDEVLTPLALVIQLTQSRRQARQIVRHINATRSR